MSELVHFRSKNGDETTGAIALPPGDDKAPALVLLQEWWGVNDHIRSLVDRFAAEGFVTLAPDLYRGATTKDAEEAGRLMTALDGKRALADIAGAVAFVAEHPRSNGKVGVTGFCMGGAYTFAAACFIPEIAAAVPFYGIPPERNADYTKVRAPILAHFSATDPWAKPSLAEAIKATLEARGQSMQLHLYDAEHAFMNDTRPEVYAPAAAKLAWERSVAFLRQHVA